MKHKVYIDTSCSAYAGLVTGDCFDEEFKEWSKKKNQKNKI